MEAKLMLAEIGFKDIVEESDITKLAEALKLAYESEITHAWPDFSKLEFFFTKQEPMRRMLSKSRKDAVFPMANSPSKNCSLQKLQTDGES
jgi:hypothetical protein